MKRILAVDPGTHNFALAVLDVRKKNDTVAFRILEAKMVSNTITELKDGIDEQMRAFVREFRSSSLKYKPTDFICERFQSRGMKGLTIECVNMMIGVMVTRTTVPTRLVTASTWKNAFNRHASLQELYDETDAVPHVVDAVCMGLYHAHGLYGLKPFVGLTDKRFSTILRIINESVSVR
jgi:hypothetical protein